MPAPRAVLFDFNGVLIHDEPVHGRALRAVLAGLGVRLTRRDYVDKYMVGDDAYAISAVLRDAGMRPGRDGRVPSPGGVTVATLVRRKRRAYRVLMGPRLRLDPGAARLLRALAGKVPVAIVSAAAGAEIRTALRASGLAGRVKTIISAESVRRTKPHAEPYLAAIRGLGLRAGRAGGRKAGACDATGASRATAASGGTGGGILTFEDSPGGIASALAAGVTAIGVATSYNSARLKRAGAWTVVPDLGTVDAGALLEGRWAHLRRRSPRPARKRIG